MRTNGSLVSPYSNGTLSTIIENQPYSIVNKVGTIAMVTVMGFAMAWDTSAITSSSTHNVQKSECIQYNSSYSNTHDLMKLKNLSKIKAMADLEDNWNGMGAKAFPKDTLVFFEAIIEDLDKQPEIAPTGRSSLLLQYELDDKSKLAFELSKGKAEQVFVPQGDYARAEIAVYTENISQGIKERVKQFYGFG